MTNTEKRQLSGVRETLLFRLYYRALDQRSKAPIVGDTWAADVLDRITADNRKGLLTAKLGVSGRFPPLLRARRLDDWGPGVSCPPPGRVRAAPGLRAG
jgi:O-methyltransferase